MFKCRSCLLRGLRAVAGDVSTNARPLRPSYLSANLPSNISGRRHAATAFATDDMFIDTIVSGKQPMTPDEQSKADSDPRDANGMTANEKRLLERELKYLPDPVKLNRRVMVLLSQDQPKTALNLCRLASRDMEAIVSWNSCVSWHMERNKIDEAIKIYNEMKKRAQFPDTYTYIALLAGLSKPHHHGQVVKTSNVTKALAIYNSMSSPTSRVKPSIMHTNATLRVCAAALDLDSLWGVVGKLPASGPPAADNLTYSIILNAIRFADIGQGSPIESLEMLTRRRDQSVRDGRRVWREVIARWRSGEVTIDSKLVASMGRLLLLSPRPEDKDDVLSLIEQTTNIKRLLPPLGHPDRQVGHVPKFAGDSIPREGEPEDAEGYRDLPAVKVFRPVSPHPADPAHPNRPNTLAWVAPDGHLLAMIIDACSMLRAPQAANAYWDLLVGSHEVQPDTMSFTSQLKLLASNRNSARAVQLLQNEMTMAGVEFKNQTFRLAMKVCARNNKAPAVVSHARAIVDKMEETQRDLDVHTLIQYLNLALMTDKAKEITGALDRLDPIVHKLSSRLSFGTQATGISPESHLVDRETTVGFLQNMVGAIDVLMNRGLVEREQYSHWHARRGHLAGIITRAKTHTTKQRERMDTTSAEAESRRAAKEAGRLFRQRRFPAEGVPEPSKQEWALKQFRSKGKSDRGAQQERDQAVERRRKNQPWGDREEKRSAYSPMASGTP